MQRNILLATLALGFCACSGGGGGGGGGAMTPPPATPAPPPVNRPPSFDPIADQTVLEDSGPQTLTIQGVSAGDGGQTVNLTAQSSDALIVPDPVVTGQGASRTLSFESLPDASGVLTITLTARDDGGTANGGRDRFVQSFEIAVLPVNDAPSFDLSGPPTTPEDTPASFSISNIDAGAGEDTQAVTFSATSDAPALFASLDVTGSGASRDLTLVPAPNAVGSATITLRATDDGGAANGGQDAFERSFSLSIDAVNDAPVFTAPAVSVGFLSEPGTIEVTGIGPGGGADEQGQPVTLSAVPADPGFFASFDLGPVQSGVATLRYLPAPGRSGTTVISLTAGDGQGQNAQSSRPLSLRIGALLGVTEDGLLAKIDEGSGRAVRASGYPYFRGRQVEGMAFDHQAGVLYLVDDEFDQLLAVTDQLRVVRPVGSKLGIDRPRALAFDPVSRTLFGTDSIQLQRIDTASGEATPIGQRITAGVVKALAFHPTTRVLYGVDDSSGELITIDPVTGQGSPVGAIGFALIESLGFDPASGSFFAVSTAANLLIRIDPSTGAGTAVGPVGFSRVRALSYDAVEQRLIGVDAVTDKFIEVDLGAGAGRVVAPVSHKASGSLAYDPGSRRFYAAHDEGGNLFSFEAGSDRSRLHQGAAGSLRDQGFQLIVSLAFDAGSDVLYATDVGFSPSGGSHGLLRVDPATGVGTRIASPTRFSEQGLRFSRVLTFDAIRGRLYSVDPDTDTLLAIDPVDGTISTVGAPGRLGSQGFEEIGGLAFDPTTDRLYAIDLQLGRQRLIRINPADASAVLIADLPLRSVEDLTVDPTTGDLFSTQSDRVVKIDKSDARTTMFGALVPLVINNAAFDRSTRQLYAFQNGVFLSIDVATGDATYIRRYPEQNLRFAGLAFDDGAQALYAIRSSSNSNDNLERIDPATGDRVTIGTLVDGLRISDLASDPLTGALFGVRRDGFLGDTLVTIDLANQVSSLVGGLNSFGSPGVFGLAFDPSSSRLYGSRVLSSKPTLLSIDPIDGAVTEVGPLGPGVGSVVGLSSAR